MHPIPLIGLASERQRLLDALRKPEPLLLLGPRGSGKSAMICAAIANLGLGKNILHLNYSASLHHLLIDLARCLHAAGHKSFRDLALERQTSVHLKGLLWTALEAEPVTIVLDGIAGASFPMYRFLQRLYFVKGMALVATARDRLSLGALGRLFWDPRIVVHVSPLNHADSARLFELAVEHFDLRDLDLEDFREKVLESANGNPGRIVEMCRLASDPMYVSGRRVKFAPLWIDLQMRFLA